MAVISGAITITDNATAVIRTVRNEQSVFKKDVEKVKRELSDTWDKKRTARLDANGATKTAEKLQAKIKPLREKVTTAVAVKDLATSKVKDVTSKITKVGKLVAKPAVNIVVKGMEGLAKVGTTLAKFGGVAVGAVTGVVAAGTAAVTKLFSGSEDAFKEISQSVAKLSKVMSNTMDASEEDIQRIVDLANQQQGIGIISAGIQLEGAQELGTYLEDTESLETLLPVLNNMLAQQYGTDATGESAVNISTMLGKVMNGQTAALSRYGYTFTAEQEYVLKNGNEAQRAAVLADVVNESVGGMNEALAATDAGRIQQVTNAFGDIKESVGEVITQVKGKFAGVIVQNMPRLQGLADTVMANFTKVADAAVPLFDKVVQKVLPVAEKIINVVGKVAEAVIPVIDKVFDAMDRNDGSGVFGMLQRVGNGFSKLMPVFKQFGSSLAGSLKTVVGAALPVLESIIMAVQQTLPVLLPVFATLFGTIATLAEQLAPVISTMVGLVSGAVAELAPVFITIFGQISEKLGGAIAFISEKMEFVTGVIQWAMPIVSDIFSTAWSIVGPIIDIAIAAFKVIFNVVQAVFPAIKGIIETVWKVIKPIVSGIGKVLSGIGSAVGWLADKLGFGNSGGEEDGQSTDDIIQDIEAAFAEQEPVVAEPDVIVGGEGAAVIEHADVAVDSVEWDAPDWDNPDFDYSSDSAGSSGGLFGTTAEAQQVDNSITITIAQLANEIIVREEADIDAIGAEVTEQVLQALQNFQPQPA